MDEHISFSSYCILIIQKWISCPKDLCWFFPQLVGSPPSQCAWDSPTFHLLLQCNYYSKIFHNGLDNKLRSLPTHEASRKLLGTTIVCFGSFDASLENQNYKPHSRFPRSVSAHNNAFVYFFDIQCKLRNGCFLKISCVYTLFLFIYFTDFS